MNEAQEKQSKADALKVLEASDGWKLVKEALQEDIDIFVDKLKDSKKWHKKDTLESIQAEVRVFEHLLGLPAELIKEYSENETNKPEFDPYD